MQPKPEHSGGGKCMCPKKKSKKGGMGCKPRTHKAKKGKAAKKGKTAKKRSTKKSFFARLFRL